MHIRLLQPLALVALFYIVNSQTPDAATSRLCNSATRCSECLQAHPSCVWCADPNYNGDASRCYVRGDPAFTCGSSFIQDPPGSSMDAVSPELGGTVQVSPTVVDVSVRPGAPVDFGLIVEPARNFPVDIYLLMDLSFSMADDLDNLKGLGAQLATAITNISRNFQVGFGSFVDKRLSPFVSLDTNLQDNPCPGRFLPDGCRSTYSFRHHVTLTNNETFFNEQVQAQTISGNQDAPEGGFDGFLQSIVCRNVVGWRDVSRKLLLYITDAGFHIAGDGKLGGVVLPHDGSCSTEPPNDYRDWVTLDYPSIGQIAELLRQNDIIPIFAAQDRVVDAYRSLVTELGEGNAFVDRLESDSRNIVSLVRDSYNNISQRIVFDRDQVPPGVAVDIQPVTCPAVINDVCTGVQIENNATFNVRVTLEDCSAQSNETVMVPIRVVGFGTFTINLNAICTCPCEDPANTVANHPSCTSNGTLICGRCDCNPGRFGEMCQCDATGQQGMEMQCPLGPTELECTSSDRGTCVCGECQCRTDDNGDLLYTGRACECDRDGCPSANNRLCSGRGVCTCEGCRCNLEPVTGIPYYGEACECTNNTNGCRDRRNDTDLCNGRGSCGCMGTCECPFPYLGEFCEDCSGSEICSDLFCGPNIPCAACVVSLLESDFPMAFDNVSAYFSNINLQSFPNGTTLSLDPQNNSTYQVRLPSGYCPAECMSQVVIIAETDDVEYMIQDEMTTRCEYESPATRCTHRYHVGILEETLKFTDVHVEARRFCPEPVAQTAPWIIAVAIIAALLVLGVIALLLLKLFLFIFDVIEVRRFEKELAKTKYSKNTNPLYRSAAKDYMNPIYGQ